MGYHLPSFHNLVPIIVSDIMTRFRKNIRFCENLIFISSGDLNIDLSKKMSEVFSKLFLTNYRFLSSALLNDAWESS